MDGRIATIKGHLAKAGFGNKVFPPQTRTRAAEWTRVVFYLQPASHIWSHAYPMECRAPPTFVSRLPSCPIAQSFARAFMVLLGTLARSRKLRILANEPPLAMTPCILIAVSQHRDAAKSAPKKAPDACSLVPTDRKRYQLPPGARGLAMRATVSVDLFFGRLG
jgi:hypothetical protein